MVFEHMFSSLRQQHWELTVESNESKKVTPGARVEPASQHPQGRDTV